MRRPIETLAVVTVLLVAGLAAGAQEKYRLRSVDAVGDTSVNGETISMQLDMTASLGDRAQSLPTAVFEERHQFTERVLQVGPAGRANAVRLAYGLARERNTDPSGKRRTIIHTYQGKVLTVRKVGGKTIISINKGKLSAADRERFVDQLHSEGDPFLPDHEVAVGDTWALDPAALRRTQQAVTHASGGGQLTGIEDYQGHRCARIHLDIDMQIGRGQPFTIDMSLSGEAYYALDIERELDATFTGTATYRQTIAVQGRKISLEGIGPARIVETARWLSIAGKPVPVAQTSSR